MMSGIKGNLPERANVEASFRNHPRIQVQKRVLQIVQLKSKQFHIEGQITILSCYHFFPLTPQWGF